MKNDHRALIVDDEASVRALLSAVLRREGFQTLEAASGEEALELFRGSQPQIVLMDISMPGMSGLQALAQMRRLNAEPAVILMTAFATVDTAVEAIKLGAFDYVIKPFDLGEVMMLVNRALQLREMREEIQFLRREISEGYRPDRIITNSPKVMELCRTIAKIAQSNASVLITGESGVGKELVATAIHFNSPRCDGPFVRINCGAIPEGLLESELFGHEKGAFTGAAIRRLGRFERAHGGTIFLDEVGELPPTLQVKLLRVLQEREFERVGGSETLRSDVRVLAATNRNLEDMVSGGTFRADLYYRLNVVKLHIPPLRERPEDIPLLSEHFLRKFAQENSRDVVGLDPAALAVLRRYPWPGNIRELANAIEHAVVMSTGSLLFAEDFPRHLRAGAASPPADTSPPPALDRPLKDMVREFECRTIAEVLARNEGDRMATARQLGISRRTLLYKLQECGIKGS